MEKVKSWAKFFFGSFFSNKITIEGTKRSFINAVMGILLSFVIILCGLAGGYCASFYSHYNKAEAYREFVTHSIDAAKLTISNNVAYTDRIINTFDGDKDAKYVINDYQLIIDTREVNKIFCDFELMAKKGDAIIGYEDYKTLAESAKKSYDLSFEILPSETDFRKDRAAHLAYLQEVSNVSSPNYNEEVAANYRKLLDSTATLSEEEYDWHLYWLYVNAYYPELRNFGYTTSPTLYNYYVGKINSSEKYFAIFRDSCTGHFDSMGISVQFNGFFTKLNGFDSDSDNADKFIKSAFNGNTGMIWFTYLLNLLQIFPIVLAIWIVLSLVVMLPCRALKMSFGQSVWGNFTIVGSYFVVSSAISFLLSFILSFFVTRQIAYTVACISFYSAIIARTAVLLMIEGIKQAKLNKEANNSDENNAD